MAQQSSLDYRPAPRGNVVDDYFGTGVADPYRWMEDLDSSELRRWIDAQNALAFGYLQALPQRDALKTRITELWNHPTVTPPRYEGGHWFYSRNTGLQQQSVVVMRETLDGPDTMVLDPNRLSPDGSIALSGFVARLRSMRVARSGPTRPNEVRDGGPGFKRWTHCSAGCASFDPRSSSPGGLHQRRTHRTTG